MRSMIASCLSIVFLVIGHSHLLASYGLDSGRISLRNVLFPWPKNGRGVACLCFAVSVFFLFRAVPFDFDASNSLMWKYSILGWLPIVIYLNFVLPRFRREDGVIVFRLEPYLTGPQRYLKFFFGALALINVLYLFLWRQ
jgi:hypothetical protein